jgi:hypothetical protein
MQRPSCDVYSHLASQEIPRLLWKTKVNYRDRQSLPLDGTPSQVNPVYILCNTPS